MRPYLYTSTPMRIGKREWRAVVYQNPGSCGPVAFTDYEWRYPAFSNIEADRWESMTTYPGYDSNDGTWAGCPKTLRRLYLLYQTEINAALKGAEVSHDPAVAALRLL